MFLFQSQVFQRLIFFSISNAAIESANRETAQAGDVSLVFGAFLSEPAEESL